MALVPLSQADPVAYSAWLQRTGNPQANLSQSQASTAETNAKIPATQAETAATTQNVPINNNAPAVNPNALKYFRDSYVNAFTSAKTVAERDALASDFQKATGAPLFSLVLPKDQLAPVQQTVATKNQINLITQGMRDDPKLKQIMGNPVLSMVYNSVANNPALLGVFQKTYGLNDSGMQALSGFIKLQAAGDRQLVGGRLTGYLVSFFGKSQPGIGRTYGDNLKSLNNMSTQMDNQLNTTVKNTTGFSKWQDVPGLDAQAKEDAASQINAHPTVDTNRYSVQVSQ